MKTICFLIVLLFTTLANAQGNLTQVADFGSNPGELDLFVQLTSESNDTLLRPLIVALHGCSQSPQSMAKVSGWDKLAEEHQLIILFPGQRRVNNPSRCFNWFLSNNQTKHGGELESIMQMIDYCKSNYPVDTNRIFVYGLSAGAAMGVNLMVIHPEVFNAGAILAGAPFKIATNSQEAMKAMFSNVEKSKEDWAALVPHDSTTLFPRLIVLHGDKDHTVNPSNSQELIKQWSAVSLMDKEADFQEAYLNPTMEKFYYHSNYRKNQIIYYKIDDIGHAIPIDPGNEQDQGGKVGLFSRDIGFFSTFYILRDFGLIH